jgi:hypothetical protein
MSGLFPMNQGSIDAGRRTNARDGTLRDAASGNAAICPSARCNAAVCCSECRALVPRVRARRLR